MNVTGIGGGGGKRASKASSGGGKGGGGGGGGGKSKSEKLIDQIKKDLSFDEHEINMIQYQETKYQNADQLGNYGKMLELENMAQKDYAKDLQDSIDKLEAQRKNVKEGSDDWWALTEAIMEYKEKLAKVNNTIDENTKKLRENDKAKLQAHIDLEDIVNDEIQNRIDRDREALDAEIDLQDTILEAIKQRYQDEWDLRKKDIEKEKEALSEKINLIDEYLKRRKDAEDEASKYEKLDEYKRQYAAISADSTRTKEAKQLKKQIEELQKEISWDIAEDEAESQKKELQDEMEAYDDYVEIHDEDLNEMLEDAKNFTDEVNEVLEKSHDDLMQWMRENVQEYLNSLDPAREQMEQDWEDTWNQMNKIIITHWNEVDEILRSEDSFIAYMKESADYMAASDDARLKILMEYIDTYEKFVESLKEDIESLNEDEGKGTEYDGSGNSGGGGSTGTGNQSSTSAPSTYTPNYDNKGLEKSKVEELQRYVGTKVDGKFGDETADACNKIFGTRDPKTAYQKMLEKKQKQTDLQIKKDNKSFQRADVEKTSEQQDKQTTKPKRDDVRASKDIQRLLGRTQTGQLSQADVDAAKLKWPDAKGINNTTALLAFARNRKPPLTEYLTGGLVDYTGPAWVDGTKSKPEAFLSAADTSLIRKMLDAAKYVITKPFISNVDSSYINGGSNSVGDISITINEANLKEDADYDEVARRVGEAFTKELSRQGFKTAAYNF